MNALKTYALVLILLVVAVIMVANNLVRGRREWRLESDTAQPDNRLGVSQ